MFVDSGTWHCLNVFLTLSSMHLMSLMIVMFLILLFTSSWLFCCHFCNIESRSIEGFVLGVPQFLILSCFIPGVMGSSGCRLSSGPVLYVEGSQWYWTYGFCGEVYESRVLALSTSDWDFPLFADTCIELPIGISIWVVCTSSDVIHSWSVTGLGVKIDCVPGHSSLGSLLVMVPGLYTGACSELCGVLHPFMPINLMFC